MSTSFMPELVDTKNIPQSAWRYTPILPLVFGMELSYMEQIAKLMQKVNEVIANDNNQNINFAALVEAFKAWEEYLNTQTIPDGAVTTPKLADGAVTTEKLSAMAVIAEHIADYCITARKIAENSISTEKIKDKAITGAKIDDGAIEGKHIKGGSITYAELDNQAVEADNLAVAAVTASKIAPHSIVTEHFEEGVVDTNAIGAQAVTAEKIANGAISKNHLAQFMAEQWNDFVKVIGGLENGNGDFTVNKMEVINYLNLAAQCVVNCGTAILHNLGTPVSDSDAATKKYVDERVGVANIGPLSVTSDKLATGAVTTAKIDNGAVTSAKLDSSGVQLPNGSTGSGITGNEASNVDADLLATIGSVISYVNFLLSSGANPDIKVGALTVNGNFSLPKSSAVNFGANLIHNVGEPKSETDAATKKYVDDRLGESDNNNTGSNEQYNAHSYDVTGDGITNDAPALNALVALVHDNGGGTIYLPKGTYMLDEPILWASNVSLRGEGMGLAVLKPRQSEGVGEGFAAIRGMTFSADAPCVNCTFEQFTIDGSEMNITEYTSWPKGINIHYMNNPVFRDLEIRNTCATGLGVDQLANGVIDHVVCINCGRSWASTGAEQNAGGAGIGIGTNSMDGESLIIQNCVADGCGNYGIFLENQGHSTPTKPESHVIANNIVRNGRNHGIIVKGDANVVVGDNVVLDNAGDGLAVLENNGYVTEHIMFSNNLVQGNGNGFRLESNGVCQDITLSGNVFSSNNNGIVLNTDTTELSLIGNTVKGSAVGLTVRGVHTDTAVRNNALYKNTVSKVFSGSFSGDTSENDYVLSPGPEAIAFEHGNYSIPVGGVLPLSVEYTPSNVSGLVTYFVDRPEIARVEGSSLVALSEGNVVVTASCGVLTASATVVVSVPADLSAYTRLNYIQSSGGQYINTGFVPNSNTRVLAKTTHDGLDPARTICGTRTASMNKEFDLRCYNQFYYGSSLVSTGVIHTGAADINKNVLRLNGTLAGVAQPEEFACEYPLYIFALNGAGTALSNTMATMKLYYLHIYDGSTVVRAMLPVRRKSDGTVGLVDALTGTFYPNLGSGSFTA